MQQKKILTGIMLLAVIGIWGYVGYSFFAGEGPTEEIYTDNFSLPKTHKVKIDITQKLRLDYPDPFLKSDVNPAPVKSNPTTVVKKTIVKKETPPVIVSNFTWPSISYRGLIKNQSHPEKVLGLIMINGQERIVRNGEKVDDLVVMNITKTNVELVHEKEKKVFGK